MIETLRPDGEERARIDAVAAGRVPADLVLTGGRVVDVAAGGVREDWTLAIAGSRIAAVGPDLGDLEGRAVRVINLRGGLVMPGLIEPHTHLNRLGIPETARLQTAAGVTTTILESAEVGFSTGLEGVRAMVEQARGVCGRILFTISPLIGLDPYRDAAFAPAGEWISLLDEPGVVGVGESFWADLLRGHERARSLNAAAQARTLAVEGHGAGAKPEVLAAMRAAGVGSDHEAINAAEALSRLELGFFVYLRHGVTRQDLPALAALWKDASVPLERVSFCTDGVDPERLLAKRSLNSVLAAAIETGLPLPVAVRMATVNPARRFGLWPWLGTLQEGALADVVVFEDPSFSTPSLVLTGGQPPRTTEPGGLPTWMSHTMALVSIDRAQFLPFPSGHYRAIEISPEAPLVTREVQSSGRDSLLAVAIDRLGSGRAFRGLVAGLDISSGAVATTTVGESCLLLVIGDNPEDMLLAAERVRRIEGGVAVFSRGRELATWSAPVAGTVSEAGAEVVAREVAAVNGALRSLGCRLPDPLISIDFLSSPAVPHLRLCSTGYVRLRDGARLGVEWEAESR